MEDNDPAHLRERLTQLQARLEVQEGQGHMLRALVAALIAAHPERSRIDNLIALTLADLQTKADFARYPSDSAHTRANQNFGMQRTWQDVQKILDDWLPPDPA